MKKIDFAIHLFGAARHIGQSHPHRVPIVSLIMLLILSRRPDEWVSGTELAESHLTLTASTFASCTRKAAEDGLIQRRPMAGGVNGALEWKITPAGQRVVADLLTCPEPAPLPA